MLMMNVKHTRIETKANEEKKKERELQQQERASERDGKRNSAL